MFRTFLCVAALFFVSITMAFSQEGYQVGDKVKDFKLKNTKGEMISMRDYPDANGYIVIFTCNHCPYSVLYEDRIIELHNKYSSQGFPVIAINSNNPEVYPADSYEGMVKRAKEKGFTFDYLVDSDQKVVKKFGATKTPEVFLLDQSKTVQYTGAIDDNVKNPQDVENEYLVEAITSLQLGEKPKITKTKAIGCSIKY